MSPSMLLRRSAIALTRQTAFRAPIVTRTFAISARRAEAKHDPKPGEPSKAMKKFEEIETEADLLPPGAPAGTIPTDLDQATGLDRLEILGKMQGIDIFDMKPLDASRRGTMQDPISVRSFGDEQFAGCTGFPADSHVVHWLAMSRDRPVERCPECGNVYKMDYVGPADDGHGHGHDDHHGHHADGDGKHNFDGEPKTMADFVRPEYRMR